MTPRPQLSFADLSSDNPKTTPEYMLAVMDGVIKHQLSVEALWRRDCPIGWVNLRYGAPAWNWTEFTFRLSPSCRAAWKAIYGDKPYHVGDWVVATFDKAALARQITSFHVKWPFLYHLDGDTTRHHGHSTLRTASAEELARVLVKRALDRQVPQEPKTPKATPQAKPFAVGDWVVKQIGSDVVSSSQPYRVEMIKADWVFTTGMNGSPDYFRHATQAEIAAHLGAQLAPGHNPDKLTNAQVGEGWRLLDRDEFSHTDHSRYGQAVQCWSDTSGNWPGVPVVFDGKYAYRTRLSRAELAEQASRAAKTVPLTADELPSDVIWVRAKSGCACPGAEGRAWLIVGVFPRGLKLPSCEVSWADLMTLYEYSPDRRTWHPFSKTVPI